jgi:hypothetical protein
MSVAPSKGFGVVSSTTGVLGAGEAATAAEGGDTDVVFAAGAVERGVQANKESAKRGYSAQDFMKISPIAEDFGGNLPSFSARRNEKRQTRKVRNRGPSASTASGARFTDTVAR